MVSVVARSLVVALALIMSIGTGAAQDRRQNKPGDFDFYVLALSWSPSFCAESRERHSRRAPQLQCKGRPYSFVVHGLWPQYSAGFPEYCQVPAPRLSRRIVSSMLDLMPSPQLVFHEWDRHGVCSGRRADAYFELVRKARAVVKIPDPYIELASPLSTAPGDVETAFIKANPGLPADAIAVTCSGKRLGEVRICLDKRLGFRACPEIDKRACRRNQVLMPPVRGG